MLIIDTVGLLTKIYYPSIKRIANVKSPILFIHSKNDDIIPYRFGKKLFKFANSPKTFLEIDGLHNNGFLTSGDKYINGIDNFIKYTLEK